MAAMAQHIQSFQLGEEVDENFVDVEEIALNGHSTRCEEYVLVSERYTYSRPQLRYDGPMANDSSRISDVEEWINQKLFGDVVEASQQLHDDGELCFTTLGKYVDEYIEIVDLMRTTPSISHSTDEEQIEQYHMEHDGTDDKFLSPVDSGHLGMYYIDEPQLWCFT